MIASFQLFFAWVGFASRCTLCFGVSAAVLLFWFVRRTLSGAFFGRLFWGRTGDKGATSKMHFGEGDAEVTLINAQHRFFVIGDEGEGGAIGIAAAGAASAVHIGKRVVWEIEIDDLVDVGYVKTTRRKVTGNKDAIKALTKFF